MAALAMVMAPPSPTTRAWQDRASLLRDRATALHQLIEQDLSAPRAVVYALCVMSMAFSTTLLTALVESLSTPDVTAAVVAVVLTPVAFLVLVVLPAVVLHRMRRQARQRWEILKAWAVLDRQPAARALPAGMMTPELATAWDRERAGYPWTLSDMAPEAPGAYQSSPRSNFRVLGSLPLLLGTGLVAATPFYDAPWPEVCGYAASGLIFMASGWSVMKKYITRYRWWGREEAVRARERRRWRARTILVDDTVIAAISAHRKRSRRLGLAAVPPLLVTLALQVAQSSLFYLLVAIAVVLVSLGVVTTYVGISRLHARRARETAAAALSRSFPWAVQVHATTYGSGNEPPSRLGAVALAGPTLHLRGVDGTVIDVPVADVLCAEQVQREAPWQPRILDILLRSGHAMELRMTDVRAFATRLEAAGVRVLS